MKTIDLYFGGDRGGNRRRWHVRIRKIQQIGGGASTSKSYFIHFFDLQYWNVKECMRNESECTRVGKRCVTASSRGIIGRCCELDMVPKLPRNPFGDGGAQVDGCPVVLFNGLNDRLGSLSTTFALIAASVAEKLNFSRLPVDVLFVEVAVVLVSMLLHGLLGHTGPAETVSDNVAAKASGLVTTCNALVLFLSVAVYSCLGLLSVGEYSVG